MKKHQKLAAIAAGIGLCLSAGFAQAEKVKFYLNYSNSDHGYQNYSYQRHSSSYGHSGNHIVHYRYPHHYGIKHHKYPHSYQQQYRRKHHADYYGGGYYPVKKYNKHHKYDKYDRHHKYDKHQKHQYGYDKPRHHQKSHDSRYSDWRKHDNHWSR